MAPFEPENKFRSSLKEIRTEYNANFYYFDLSTAYRCLRLNTYTTTILETEKRNLNTNYCGQKEDKNFDVFHEKKRLQGRKTEDTVRKNCFCGANVY